MRRIAGVLLALVLVIGCAADPIELQGIDLPPASVPDDFELEVWAISFSLDLVPGSWSEGMHRYELSLDCSGLPVDPVQPTEHTFSVTPQARSFDNVFFRINGMGTSLLGPTGSFAVRPDQRTTAVITVLGISEQQATEATSCSGEVSFDDAPAQPLVAGEPFRP